MFSSLQLNMARTAVVLGALVLCSAGCQPGQEVENDAAKPRPLVVIGVDGATWDLIDPMMEHGELPHFQRLVEGGARADLVAFLPLSSPAIWTTFATGLFPRHHNILDHTYPYVAGPKRPVSSVLRRAPAIWNVASHHDRRVAVVGYFATHPPDRVDGVMVSDRAARGADGAIFPAEVAAELQPILERLEDEEEIAALRQQYLPWPYDERAARREGDPYRRVTEVVKGRIGKHVIYEEFIRRAALQLAAPDFDLFMVYLRMPDHASHATWLYFDPEPFDEKPDPFDQELLQGVIPTAYRQADSFLGQLRDELGDDVNLVVLSDHGFGPAAGKWQPRNKPLERWELSGAHRPDGIFLASGPDVKPGRLEGITSLDVAPTLLALAGLPISEELPGRVAEGLFRSEFTDSFPIRKSSGYSMSWQLEEEGKLVDEDVEADTLEMLASLGYVDGQPTVAEAPDPDDLDFWSVDARIRRNAILGEALFEVVRGRQTELEEIERLLEEHDPQLAQQLPRVLKRHFDQWQECFDFPLMSTPWPESLRPARTPEDESSG